MWFFYENIDLFISIAAGVPVLVYFASANLLYHFRKKGLVLFIYKNLALSIPVLYLVSLTIIEKLYTI